MDHIYRYRLRTLCPLCSEERFKILDRYLLPYGGTVEDVRLRECLHCGFVYCDKVRVPVKNAGVTDYFGIDGQNIARWEKRKLLQKKRIYSCALSLLDSRPKSACDVGSASGYFLDCVVERFSIEPQNCLAVDLDARLLEYCAGVKGYCIWQGDLHSLRQDNGFDLITFMEVLEHVAHPKEDLRKAFTLLSPGGQLIIEVPNISFQYQKARLEKLLNIQGDGLMPEIHVNHFKTKVLKRFLEKIGFREIKIVPRPFAVYDRDHTFTVAAKRLYDLISIGLARSSSLVISSGYFVFGRKMT